MNKLTWQLPHPTATPCHTTSFIDFENLCRDASERLGLADTGALAMGLGVSLGDVLFEAIHAGERNSLLLLADLGALSSDAKVRIHQSLLAAQPAGREEPRVRFGFHPMHETAVLCIGTTLCEKTDGAWMAALLKSVTLHVAKWRKTGPAQVGTWEPWTRGSTHESQAAAIQTAAG
jgi:hypothetical protein